MAWWDKQSGSTKQYGITNADGVSVSAGALSFGAWTEIIASTDFPAQAIVMRQEAVSNRGLVLNVAIGAAGSEVPILKNLYVGNRFNSAGFCSALLEWGCYIPKGSRVSVQIASNVNSAATSRVGMLLLANSDRMPVRAILCDAPNGTSTLFGIPCAPSATADVWGSWTQLMAAAAEDIHGGRFIINGNDTTSKINARMSFQIGVGSSGNEVAIYNGFLMMGASCPTGYLELPGLVIKKGQRVTVRLLSSASVATLAQRDMDIAFYGYVR